MMEVTARDGQTGNGAHVQIVVVTVRAHVVGEFAVFDRQRGLCIIAGEQAHFVQRKAAITQPQGASLKTDARTIATRHVAPLEIETLRLHSVGTYDPDGLALSGGARGQQAHAPTNGPQFNVVMRPYGDICDVVSRVNFDALARLCLTRCLGQALNCAARSHAQDAI